MKADKRLNIIIVSGHFPPSNLVGIHRARYLTKYLPDYNIYPLLVTVHERFYEEKPDLPLLELVPDYVRVEKVNAFKIGPFRTIGDIGLRGFFQLLSRIVKLIRKEKISFLYITIPSFYTALLGRLANMITGIPYGIDYQDPWVHLFPGGEKKFSKAWWATKLSEVLEPFAVKKAALITGVNEKYYEGVIKRNPHLKKQCQFLSIPIGIDEEDLDHASMVPSDSIFNQNQKIKLIYAGALLPRAVEPFRHFCHGLAGLKEELENLEIYFLGTGKQHDGKTVSYIKPVAEAMGLWNEIIFEHPTRVTYLDTLAHLKMADGILILGSDETHYSPSKVYQSVLARKPIFAILNSRSNAVRIIRETNSGVVLPFEGPHPERISIKLKEYLNTFLKQLKGAEDKAPEPSSISPFLARNITKKLADQLFSILPVKTGSERNNILIIYPHWPPSNLAGVHRPRLISNKLIKFDWHPIILTVSHEYYEETLDWDMVKTVHKEVEVIYTKAMRIMKPRLIGDIGLRGMKSLYQEARRVIESRQVDFIWIPIPSFYTSLLGRRLYDQYKIPYGIDYIDPWIRDISNRRNWRSVASLWLARILEPYAVKKASLITGVAYEYYKPVLKRNFPYLINSEKESDRTQNSRSSSSDLPLSASTRLPVNRSTGQPISHLAFPYGFDPDDYKVETLNTGLPWDPDKIKYPVVYAGAFLPKARILMQYLFESLRKMKNNADIPAGTRFYFIGTGAYEGVTIRKMAGEYDIEDLIEEKRERLPYLTILNILKNAYGIMVIGSTEPHYTASKIYQAILSKRPVMAILHCKSQAYQVLNEINADNFTIAFEYPETILGQEVQNKVREFLSSGKSWSPHLEDLNQYSAEQSAGKLVREVERLLDARSITSLHG